MLPNALKQSHAHVSDHLQSLSLYANWALCITAFNFTDINKEIIENMANQVGKRYVCTVCGAEFIVTRGGDGKLHCCGKKMEIKK